jgi:hypothetical protein
LSTPGVLQPTQAGFQAFITNVMGVPPAALSPSDPVVTWCFDFAVQWVNTALCSVPGVPGAWTLYARAVYNLAADTLINTAQDGPGSPTVKTADGDLPYWQGTRFNLQINNFVAGVVQSTSDEGTSASFLVPESFSNYTIANLQNLKTPYGRAYLGIAQSWGPVWGLN